ncbi:MAG TPA: PAS domain-containing protein, partial [Anaerolineae bacterium]
MVDSSRHWEYLVEANGQIGYVSPACEAISGYSPEEFAQDPNLLATVLYPEDRPTVGPHFPEAADSANEASLEFRIITKSGEVRWILHH